MADENAAQKPRSRSRAPKNSVEVEKPKPASLPERPVEKSARKRTVRNFPASTFEEATEYARRIFEIGSGQPVKRLTLFNAMGKSPDSSASRQLITNSNKYGLTKGSYTSEQIELTDVGRKCVDNEFSEREVAKAQIEAAIYSVEPFKSLYGQIVNNKLPQKAVLVDKIKELDVEADAAEEAVDTFILNLRFVRLLQMLSGAERIVTEDFLLDQLPAAGAARTAYASPATENRSLVTSEYAEYETTAFYVTPIGADGSDERQHSDLFLSSLVEPAIESLKLKVVRADKIEKPGIITTQIIQYLLRSRLVIADLSFHNPNVFYELAIRHMVKKPVVQIIRQGDRIPFDVGQVRTVTIDNSSIYSMIPKLDVYRSDIATHCRRALESPEEVDNPLSQFIGDGVQVRG